MDTWIPLVLAIAGVAGTVEVHLESKEGGFFLKHVSRQHYADLGQHAPPPSPPPPPDEAAAGAGAGAVLSVDRFSVVQSSRPVSVRATYGPFSTKQTVPARYVVPDPLDLPQPPLPLPHNGSLLDAAAAAGAAAAAVAAAAAGAAPRRLDVSAHIVRPQLPRDQPQLRVLFHAGTGSAAAADVGPGLAALGGRRHPRQRVCIVLHATLGDRPPLTAACSPDGEDGVCLAQVTVPATWWPPLSPPGWGGPSKWPPRRVQLAYSVLEPRGEGCVARVQIQPVAPLGSVLLAAAASAYRELRAPGPASQHGGGGGGDDGLLALLLPRAPLYPRARLHAPLFLLQPAAALLVVKVRVKNGLRLLGAEASSDRWNVTASLNGKHTAATVTAFRRDSLADAPPQLQPSPHNKPGSGGGPGGGGGPSKAEEVFSLLVAVSDEGGAGAADARLVLSARYVLAGDVVAAAGVAGAAPRKTSLLEAAGRRRHTARLEVHKDDIQAVLPISKNWEVMNTAVLTGHQVSQAMKVFIVSQAGKVADVTLQSACHSEDESVLKVSSSCSSVYVDGSEIRGSSNASVVVKYGTYTGLARFTVWMPEFPLEVSVADFRLSQVKGWRVPDEHPGRGGNKLMKREAADVPRWGKEPAGYQFQDMMEHDHKASCRLRFQQSPVEVYARFSASDQDSGRVSYFVNRRTWLRVTDLVETLLRVSDPRIASLSGRILQGRGVGRSEVQVLSPTGRVIGAKEVRVGNDKVSITRLQVRVVSGLQLSIVPDSAVENGYVAETSVTRKLTAQYQEGLLDIDLEFSDGTRTPLREVAVSDYHLLVESLDPEVVAFAPMVTSPHPRVIAVGEGRGDLLRVALLPADACRGGGGGVARGRPAAGAGAGAGAALAAASAYVEVDFSGSDLPQRPDLVQNDGGPGVGGGLPLGFGPRSSRDMVADVPDISIGFPLKDENNHEPTVQARQHSAAVSGLGGAHVGGGRGSHVGGGVSQHHLGGGAGHGQAAVSLTPLEIGMYVLLAAFCFAIVVFVVSCVVYASKFKPLTPMEAAMVGARGPALGAAGGSSGAASAGAACLGAAAGAAAAGAGPPKGQEPTTTNAHDWVWLGRATLERASGHAVVNNNNNNNCKVRITANPLEQSTEMQAAAVVRHAPAVDSSTYCKKEKDKERDRERERDRAQPPTPVRQHSREPAMPTPPERMWQIRSSGTPPPLPPHGLVASAPPAAADKPLEAEYRPPVPPHRNMGVTARIGPSAAPGPPLAGFQQSPAAAAPEAAQPASPLPVPPPPPPHQQLQAPPPQPRRHHHHHHHHRSNRAGGGGGAVGHEGVAPEQPPQRHKSRRSSGHQQQPQPPPQVQPQPQVPPQLPPHQHQLQHHQHQLQQLQLQHEAAAAAAAAAAMAAGANSSDFVPGAQRGAGGGSEVKRATIVGNPMFSAGAAVVAGGVALSGAAHDDLVGLDDLNLGMDYDQIMEYFDNLKESNA